MQIKEVIRLLYCADDIYKDVKDERDNLKKKHKFRNGSDILVDPVLEFGCRD
jgi:hypothetical protein